MSQDIADTLKAKLNEVAEPAPVSEPAPVEPTPEVTEPAPKPEPEKTGPARDESGKFTKAKAKASAAAEGATANGDPPAPTSADRAKAAETGTPGVYASPPVPAAEPAVTYKPPQAWRPAAREQFGKLPPEVQAEIDRVERETKATIQETAAARKAYQEIQEAYRPFEPVLASLGYTPAAQIAEHSRFTYTMTQGSPQQKAGFIASMINSSGVDLDLINEVLSGQPPPAQQAQPQGVMTEAQLEAWFARKAQAAQQQRAEQEWRSAVQGHEFGADLEKLARAIAQAQGVSPKEAMTLAQGAHPEIGPIMRQREAANAAQGGNASIQRAKLAASSVKSSPATGVGANGASLEIEDLFRANLR